MILGLPRLCLGEAATDGLDHQLQCLNALASTAVLEGRRVEALPWFEELIRREDASGAPGPDRAQKLADLAVLRAEAGEYSQALEALRQAETLMIQTGDSGGLLLLRTNRAQIYRQLGRIDEALALFEQVEADSRKAQDARALARSLCGGAKILEVRGRIEEAQKKFEECLALERRNGRPKGQAEALNHLAKIEQMKGHYNRAMSLFEQSRAVSHEADPPSQLLSLALGAGVYQELHQEGERAAQPDRILDAALRLGAASPAKRELLNAMQLFAANRPGEALLRIGPSLALARQTGARAVEMQLLELRALLYFVLDRFDESLSEAEEALAISRDLGDHRKQAEILFLIGYVSLRDRRVEGARIALEQALRLESEAIGSGPQARTLWALGVVYGKLGKFYPALSSYCQATEVVESDFSEVQADDLLAGLTENAYLAYGRWAHLLAVSDEPEKAFAVTERARARMFLRRMGNAPPDLRGMVDPVLLAEQTRLQRTIESLTREIRERQRKATAGPDDRLADLAVKLNDARLDYGALRIRIQQASPAYAALVLPSPLAIPEVQKLLDGETTLIEYLVLEDAGWAWVIERDSFQLVRLPLDGNTLTERIEELRQRIATREPIDEQSSRLYRSLFEPLARFVHHPNLLVVPHGALHALPFGALTPDLGKTWLAEKYAFSVLPSASVLPFVLAQRKASDGKLLALGDPDGTLPAAAIEARAISSLYGGKALVGSEATAAALRNAPRPIGVLHLATHAVFDPVRPLFSRIRLADAEFTGYDILNLDLQGTRLVVLSGCETAVGPSDVAELEGLNRAFLYAGASAVAATLWKVDDEASGALILAFYRHLRAGAPTAEALRLAQVEILRGPEKWHHPYYWAAFQLTGAPD